MKDELQRILSYTRRAVDDYSMIEDGDSVAVGVSGGKDSLTLLAALAALRRFYPKKFTLCAIMVDMGFEGSDTSRIEAWCKEKDVVFHVVKTDIAKVIFDIRKESNPCSLCAKMRRGALYSKAKELGCNRVALGHHFDDAVETFMLNLFHEGRIGCFSPVSYLSNTELYMIRPLIYANEKAIKSYVKGANLPITPSLCPEDQHTEREVMKQMLHEKEREYPGLKHRIFTAMCKEGIDGFKTFDRLPD